jgi:SAM-dependent methyltransferase
VVREWNERADELAAQAYEQGAPTAWFDRLYAEASAGATTMPWDRSTPHPLLAEWADAQSLTGRGRRAVVVGCGLGADAEFLQERGFATTGFDVAPTAIEQARRRHPGSGVDYRVADLLALPEEWPAAFDLVVEIFTLQALPDPPRQAAAAGVRSLVAPGGTLLLVAFRAVESVVEQGPPFPLSEEFVRGLGSDGLELVELERLDGPRWRASYQH